ncbi:MAG: hypothetical protein KJ607_03460 [Bacteroidetes bacterium]|nr:hypothetical protein [Bacteroidota bacterium]
MIRFFSIVIIFLFIRFAGAQQARDSSMIIPMFSATYSVQLPGGDLADRFGVNSLIGGTFHIKLKSNWIFGIEAGYLFGKDLREEGILDSISDSNGEIITMYGDYSLLSISERGMHICGKAGKILPVLNPNANSGILLMGGLGLLQHKIWIEVEGNNAPQIQEEYRKGYDRLTNGLALSEFIGYLYFGNSRLVNFYAGFGFVQAWTKNRRSFNFDTMEHDDRQRLDLLYSFRVGWVIPLYKRMPQKYYIY